MSISPGARIVKVSPDAAKVIPGFSVVSATAAAEPPKNCRLLMPFSSIKSSLLIYDATMKNKVDQLVLHLGARYHVY